MFEIENLKRTAYFVLLICTGFSSLYAQEAQYDDLKTMIPATPTTAALGKYGEIGVAIHTGVPNISVPLHQLMGKDLNLPIDLSYHASGIRVDEVSSWVGLGWSLHAGGVITRQIRSMPDEGDGGHFFNPYKNSNLDANAIDLSLKGLIDLEPDIFYFNFASESGNFIFNKEDSTFVTIPLSKKKISYIASQASWQFTTENGTNYYFNDREVNSPRAIRGPEILEHTAVTGWYLSKIVNANKTDSITFEYETYGYSYQDFISSGRYLFPNYSEACASLNTEPANLYVQNIFEAKRLKNIVAKSGRVAFNVYSTTRCDVSGDFALESIDVYNNKNELLFTYRLSHDYFGPGASPCTPGIPADAFRLKLLSVDKVSGGIEELYRSFSYMTNTVPSRTSFARDYWGYYNNANSNVNLIPPVVVQTSLGPVLFAAAERNPSTVADISQIAMLTRIGYPTGGHTSFEYENHRVDGAFAPAYVTKSVNLSSLDGTGPIYQKQFTVNVPPNELNGFNPEGGFFMNTLIDGITCTYGPEATSDCAIISISGPSGFTITQNLTNRYMPNGTYTLTVDFHNNIYGPASWQDFYVQVSWKEIDQQVSDNSPIGGLRIRRITDVDPESNKVVHEKIFKYTTEADSLVSSAKLPLLPSFSRMMTVRWKEACPPPANCTITKTCDLLYVSVNSNYAVTGLGGSLTYNFVTVLDNEEGSNGKTTYKFTDVADQLDPDGEFPFTPTMDYDWRRGQPLETKEFAKDGSSFRLVRHGLNTYKYLDSDVKGVSTVYTFTDLNYVDDKFLFGHYINEPYFVKTGFVYQDTSIVRTYDQADVAKYKQSTTINKINPLHYNVVRQETVLNDGSQLVSKRKYVEDYTGTGSDTPSLAIAHQKAKNINNLIENVILRKRTTDSTVVGGSLTLYEVENNMLVKDRIKSLPAGASFSASAITGGQFQYASAYEDEIEFTRYDAKGNVLEGLAKDGIVLSFVWDEDLQLIAQIKGAASTAVYYTSFEDATANFSTTARTGAKSYLGSYLVTPPGAGAYQLTYWKKQGGADWQLVETSISTATTIGDAETLIDEVRVFPAGALMTTYTYKPGIGISSITDTNNTTAYYEYDNFHRLLFVRDQNGDILKNYQYHYRTQE